MKYLIITAVSLLLFFGIRYMYFKPKYMLGAQAPMFESVRIDMEPFSLEERVKDKLVLIDFWGSWCGPCRAANPKIVSLYDEFAERGFDVVSIGVETSERAWKKAIVADDLHWENHILQANRFASPIAELYGIREIPTTYLLDKGGRILGVNMTYEQLHAIIDAKLPKK